MPKQSSSQMLKSGLLILLALVLIFAGTKIMVNNNLKRMQEELREYSFSQGGVYMLSQHAKSDVSNLLLLAQRYNIETPALQELYQKTRKDFIFYGLKSVLSMENHYEEYFGPMDASQALANNPKDFYLYKGIQKFLLTLPQREAITGYQKTQTQYVAYCKAFPFRWFIHQDEIEARMYEELVAEWNINCNFALYFFA